MEICPQCGYKERKSVNIPTNHMTHYVRENGQDYGVVNSNDNELTIENVEKGVKPFKVIKKSVFDRIQEAKAKVPPTPLTKP